MDIAAFHPRITAESTVAGLHFTPQWRIVNAQAQAAFHDGDARNRARAGELLKRETPMNNPNEQALLEKLKQLPPERVAEVEDFVDFLRTRGNAQQLTQAAARAAEPAFKKVWDNPDDAAYDRL